MDYEETFSSTLKQDSLRVITNLSTYYNFDIYQLDIKIAYHNTEIDEELYMEVLWWFWKFQRILQMK